MKAELNAIDIPLAAMRLDPVLRRTPLLRSRRLDELLGHQFLFKAECLQRVGAFKARGVINTLKSLKENNQIPKKVVAHSSGNHAQAVAWGCSYFGIPAEIHMPKSVSAVKLAATRGYGAKAVLSADRDEAERKALEAEKKGAFLLHPYDNDQVIAGQGTAAWEALYQAREKVDAVFAPCGGGGLLSGTLIAAKSWKSPPKVIGAEPEAGNDAAQSLKAGKVVRLSAAPDTIADGARTLCVSERTLTYLKQLHDLMEIPDREILYWTQWLCHLLKVHVEPTAALGMAAAARWTREQTPGKTVIVILSGGNMDPQTARKVWAADDLEIPPGTHDKLF